MSAAVSSIRPALSVAADKLKKKLSEGAIGMSLAALEVMKLSERWEDYRAEADGRDLTQWLRAEVTPTYGLPWYTTMARCVESVGGERVACRMHHTALFWLVQNMASPRSREAVIAQVHKRFSDNGRAPLSKGEVLTIARRLKLMPPTKHKECSSCAKLRAQVEALGGTPEV